MAPNYLFTDDMVDDWRNRKRRYSAMEVKQSIINEVTVHSVEVEFVFDVVENGYEDKVDAAVDEGLQGFYERGYQLVDHDEFFQKDSAGNWSGTYIAFLEREGEHKE